MFYEFVETPKGWRVFWGIDPQSESQDGPPSDPTFVAAADATVLPFLQIEEQPRVVLAA